MAAGAGSLNILDVTGLVNLALGLVNPEDCQNEVADINLDSAINIIDGSFAMMAIPTLISSIILAPKVIAEANKFLAR